jgi:hypothetical protein
MPMIRAAPKKRGFRKLHVRHLRLVVLMALVVCGSFLGGQEATANAAMAAAAQTADGGIGACANNSGKALYDCVASVLDKLSSDISNVNVPATRSALQTGPRNCAWRSTRPRRCLRLRNAGR